MLEGNGKGIAMKAKVFFLGFAFLLLSACSTPSMPNPFEPPSDLNLSGPVDVSIEPAFPVVATDMVTIIRVHIINNIPVAGIYCVKVNMTAPAGYQPADKSQSIISILEGSRDVDFKVRASKTKSVGTAFATVKWNTDSSCATTQYSKKVFAAIQADSPWTVYVSLDKFCFVDGQKDAIFSLSAYESWRYQQNQLVESPWVAEFKVPPVAANYSAGASAYCLVLVGNVLEWENGIPKLTPKSSSLPIGTDEAAEIRGSGQSIILNVPSELFTVKENTPTPDVASSLGTIEAAAAFEEPPALPEQTDEAAVAVTEQPALPEQATPVSTGGNCSWQEDILGLWDGDMFYEFAQGGFGTSGTYQMVYQCNPQNGQLEIDIYEKENGVWSNDIHDLTKYTVSFDGGNLILTSVERSDSMTFQRVNH